MLILVNNKFQPAGQTQLPLDLDLLRGYGVFETLRTYGEREFFLVTKHLARLFTSAKKIGLKIKYNQQQLLTMLRKISQHSPYKEQRIKIVALPKSVLVFSDKIKDCRQIQQKGVKCLSVVCERYLPEVKSISYLPSFLSHRKAEQQGYHEAILTDQQGEVYEGAYSSIFWFTKDNQLCTRPAKILPGLTRQTILRIAPFKINLQSISLANLKLMPEVFLTSSLQGLIPIRQIDRQKIGRPGPNTRKLQQAFQAEIEQCKTQL